VENYFSSKLKQSEYVLAVRTNHESEQTTVWAIMGVGAMVTF